MKNLAVITRRSSNTVRVRSLLRLTLASNTRYILSASTPWAEPNLNRSTKPKKTIVTSKTPQRHQSSPSSLRPAIRPNCPPQPPGARIVRQLWQCINHKTMIKANNKILSRASLWHAGSKVATLSRIVRIVGETSRELLSRLPRSKCQK